MNVEEMVEKIRQLAVVGDISKMQITCGGEYLIDIEVRDPNIILKFTSPQTHPLMPSLPNTLDDNNDYDIDF